MLGHTLSRHVLVLGSGVVGLCVALYCLRRAFAVTLVDRESSVRSTCSFGNSGMIVPSHLVPLAAPGAVWQGVKWMLDPVSPFYVKPRLSFELFSWMLRFARSATRDHVLRAGPLLRDLCLASRASYEELAAQPGFDFGFVKDGLLVLCRTARAWHEEQETAAFARELALTAELYEGSKALALEPSLQADIAGAVYYPQDCHLAPGRLMACLEAEVARAGGRFRWETEIAGWQCDAGGVRAARTRDGSEIEADEFVLCAGAWSPHTVRELGLRMPIQAGKGYSLTLPVFAQAPAHCAILSEARVAVTPMNGGVRVGGTMELAGLNRDIDARRVRAIVSALPRYYSDMMPDDFAGVAPWSGLRPCSPDGLPYLGRTRRRSNLTVAAGHAMMGVTLAPITGKIVAMLLSGEPPPFDMAQLSPDRF